VIIFSSVRFLSKKNNQIEIKKTETEPKPGQTDRFWFGFLGPKPVQTGLARLFPVMLGFFGLTRFFCFFCFGSVRFGFFGFRLIKPKPNRTEPTGFSKILIGFFSRFSFFGFFFVFSVFQFFCSPLLREMKYCEMGVLRLIVKWVLCFGTFGSTRLEFGWFFLLLTWVFGPVCTYLD